MDGAQAACRLKGDLQHRVVFLGCFEEVLVILQVRAVIKILKLKGMLDSGKGGRIRIIGGSQKNAVLIFVGSSEELGFIEARVRRFQIQAHIGLQAFGNVVVISGCFLLPLNKRPVVGAAFVADRPVAVIAQGNVALSQMLEQQCHVCRTLFFEIGRRLPVARDGPLIIPLALKTYGVVPCPPVVDFAGGSAALDSVDKRRFLFAKSDGV